jgi:hypothetical protein
MRSMNEKDEILKDLAYRILNRKLFSVVSEGDIKNLIPKSFKGRSIKMKGIDKLEKSDIQLLKETLETITNDFLLDREQERKEGLAPFAELTSSELKNISKKFYISEINVDGDNKRKIISVYVDLDNVKYKGYFWEYDIDIRDGEVFYVDQFADRL